MPDDTFSHTRQPRRVWPIEKIKELIEKAEETGYHEAELSSAKEATLFRFAVKNYKKRYGVGENLTTNIEGNTVIVRLRPEVKIKESGQ